MSATKAEALDNDQYTVGWICALEIELIAARQFLDQIHGRPKTKSRNDKNSYVLGEAEGHNVVVAVLPDGVYGTTSATRVLENMLGSFTNVRIGLMVGIGGGAPSKKNNIMLGDIVVSVPTNSTGGVFQYRYGKDIQGKDFLPTGHLNRTPSSILAAVNNLGSEFAIEGNNIKEGVEAACALIKKEFTRNKCKRPSSVDQLYDSNFIHPDAREPCATICASDTHAVVNRSEWSPREDEPMIFRGIIASADQLMKNALVRDKWSQEKDVLCFEMEAAGLMQDFPCVAIRGICDYSDTHKNDVWHGYAAMSAAAYAKNLLRVITPDEILGEPKLAKIEKQLTVIEEVTSATHATVLKIDAEQAHIKLREWIHGHDRGFEDVQASTLRKRWPGTAEWILNHNDFETWFGKPDENQIVWCNGGPGTGKSVLASVIVNHVQQQLAIRNQDSNLVYAYFGYQDPGDKRTESIVAALLQQLIGSRDQIPDVIEQTFKDHSRQNKKPVLSIMTAMFCEVAKQASEIFIVIDALDEYPEEERERFFGQFLDQILIEVGSAKILVTSRPETGIADYLRGHSAREIKIGVKHTKADIKKYVEGQLDLSVPAGVGASGRLKKSLQVQDPQVREFIIETLSEKSDGMFLWVDLQLNLLFRQRNEEDVLEVLGSLPRSLNDTYFRILQLVEEEARPLRTLVIKCLMWSIYSRSHMRLYELREVVVLDETTTDITQLRHARQRYTTADILDACRGLLVSDDDYYRDPINGWSSTRIIHFSFWQYIMTDDRVLQTEFALLRDSDAVESELAHVCISHLTQVCLQDGPAPNFDDLRIRIAGKNTPFAWYCARFFDEHAVTAGVVGDLQTRLYELLVLDVSKLGALMQLRHMRKPNYRGDFRAFGSGVNARTIIETSRLVEVESIRNDSRWKSLALYQSSIHQACATGLTRQVQHLIDLGADVNALDEHGKTPFAVAIMRMRIEIVTILLRAGVDVNQPISSDETALEVGSSAGYEELVALLLDSGATGIENDRTFTSALYNAVWMDNSKVAMFLISQGAECTESVLLCAAEVGMTEVVRSCLHSGISPDGQVYEKPVSEDHMDPDTRPLYRAAKWGWTDTTRVLLEYNADVGLVGGSFGTSLQAASLSGREDIVTLLLEKSSEALINHSEGEFGTALSAAAFNGQASIVQLLLNAGADVNISGGMYEYALVASVQIGTDSAASSHSWMSTTHGLGEGGPKMEIYRGFRNATKQLIDAGANIAEQGEAALKRAIENGYTQLVDLLLSEGARFNPQVFSTVIESAPANLVKLMLQIGADPNQEGEDGKRPLVSAVQRDDIDVVKILIEGGADPNLSAKGKSRMTRPLHEACTKANLSLVNILLDAGADINLWGDTQVNDKLQGGGYACGHAQGSALHAACSGGSDDHPDDRDSSNKPRANIVKLLLDKGAKADVPNEEGWTALGLACSRHDMNPIAYNIAKVLLDHGVDHHLPCEQYTSALEVAARYGYEEIVQLILKVGLTDEHLKQNALQVAAEEGYTNIVRCLIDGGVDVSVPLGNSTFVPVGDKPIHGAASNGQFDMAKELIEAGADINEDGHFGSVYETALVGHTFSYVGKGEWGKLIALLKLKGAEEPSATCHYGIRCNGPKCAGNGKFATLYWFERASARPTDWVRGTRYKCEVCEDFNLCETCNDIFLEKAMQVSYGRQSSAPPQDHQAENDAWSQDHDDTSSPNSDASYTNPPSSHTTDHIINVMETRESLGVETMLGSVMKKPEWDSELKLVHEVDAMDVELFS